jgi:hypothetical protein
MTALTGFYDYVMPGLPNVGADLALQAIREACVDFCEKSLVYTYDVPAINVVGSTHTYAITPEVGTRTFDVLEVFYNGTQLSPASDVELDGLYSDWRSTGTGVPAYYTSKIDRSSIRLVKTPADSLADGLVVKIAQAPLATATDVPDWLLERYRQAVAHGAKAVLYAMPKKPWSDGGLSKYHSGLFEAECGRANISKAKQHTRKRLRSTVNFR